ncbi:MAG: hypothetical protein LBE76_05495 [Nitrososphaerota archaeon]|jgi:hypothetical protein|nr:hypothetical protein [Nitrososphaerota archaeon]
MKPSLNQKQNNHRARLFNELDNVIAVSSKKLTLNGNSDRAKLGYGRLLISAISVYGSLLKDVELEQLKSEVETLKETLSNDDNK